MATNRVSSSDDSTEITKLFAFQKLIKYGSYSAYILEKGSSISAESFNENGGLSIAVTSSKGAFDSNNRESIDEKWKDLGEMSQQEAKREFLLSLISIAPYWKYEQFLP
jgi:hypothetical protein